MPVPPSPQVSTVRVVPPRRAVPEFPAAEWQSSQVQAAAPRKSRVTRGAHPEEGSTEQAAGSAPAPAVAAQAAARKSAASVPPPWAEVRRLASAAALRPGGLARQAAAVPEPPVAAVARYLSRRIAMTLPFPEANPLRVGTLVRPRGSAAQRARAPEASRPVWRLRDVPGCRAQRGEHRDVAGPRHRHCPAIRTPSSVRA